MYRETAIGSSQQWLHQLGQIAISQPSLSVRDSRGVDGAGLCSAPYKRFLSADERAKERKTQMQAASQTVLGSLHTLDA